VQRVALALEELASQAEVDAEYVRQLARVGRVRSAGDVRPVRTLDHVAQPRQDPRPAIAVTTLTQSIAPAGVVKPKRSPAATTMAIPKTKK